ncbi:MAG: twin-arginine translocation signal domain-containing protein, partial [Mesorhizobium sp.]
MRTPLIDRRDFLRAAGVGFAAAMAPRAWADT